MKILIICAVLCTLAGCATPQYNYSPQKTNLSNPPIGSVNTAFVGDSMIKQGILVKYDAIYLPKRQKINWLYTLLPGYYTKKGVDNNSEYFLPSKGKDGGDVRKAALADNWEAVHAYKNKPTLCVVSVFHEDFCKDNANFKREKRTMVTPDTFQQTLIYNGKVGQKIDIGYREFSGDLARPAFSNNVEYDLNDSNVIGYKGARLKILKANNQSITYKVISNFNGATQ